MGPMNHSPPKSEQFLAAFRAAFDDGTFLKLSLRAYRGDDQTLKSIDARPVLVRKRREIGFTQHFKTRDIVKNFSIEEAMAIVKVAIGTSFFLLKLSTTTMELTLDLTGKTPKLRQAEPTETRPASLSHDREKKRPIAATSNWLHALGVTDENGRVLPTAGDKFRQINRFVEILGPLLAAIPKERLSKIVDMGAGKGYLTFAVADHLRSMHAAAEVVGVELRPDLVQLCNTVATQSGLDRLSFAEGTIDSFDATGASALIALHACDTATDDAIAKGIAAGAGLIVVAPCCHKQVRREVEAAHAENPLGYLMKHGIFVERQCEMVTDGIRALVLEYFGYKTKVFDFISDEHTPKNVMIVGTKTGRSRDPAILQKINEAKGFFGIRRHYLETATKLAV